MTIPAVPLDGSLSRLLLLPPWKLRSSLRLPHSVPSLSSGHLPYRRAHWHLLALTLLDSLRLNDSFKVTPLTLHALAARPELSILSSLSWDSVNGQKLSRSSPHLCIRSALTAATPPPPQEVALASHLSWLPGPPPVSVMSTEHI